MIKRIDIDGVHLDLDDELKKYVAKKIGRLDRFISRRARDSVHAEVKLKEAKATGKDSRVCEVVLHLPHETIALKESTINIYAAIDIVEQKLKAALIKYKETQGGPAFHRRMLGKFKRQLA